MGSYYDRLRAQKEEYDNPYNNGYSNYSRDKKRKDEYDNDYYDHSSDKRKKHDYPTINVNQIVNCCDGKKDDNRSPQGVANVFFTGSNERVSIPATGVITLTLPPITVSQGQSVELDAFATGTFHSTSVLANFGVNFQIFLRRNGNLITSANEQDLIEPGNSTLSFNPSLTWVDSPPPGTHVYSLEIAAGRLQVDDTRSSFGPRALTAKIVNRV